MNKKELIFFKISISGSFLKFGLATYESLGILFTYWLVILLSLLEILDRFSKSNNPSAPADVVSMVASKFSTISGKHDLHCQQVSRPNFHFHTSSYFPDSCKKASLVPGGENQVQIV